jgi:hypothetical protein
MSEKTDKEIAAEILITLISANPNEKGLQYQREDVADEQVTNVINAFNRIYQAVKAAKDSDTTD